MLKKILPFLIACLFLNLNAQIDKAKEHLDKTTEYADRVDQHIKSTMGYARKISGEDDLDDKQYLMKRAKSEAEYAKKYAQYVNDEIYKTYEDLEDSKCTGNFTMLNELDESFMDIKASCNKAYEFFHEAEYSLSIEKLETRSGEGVKIMKELATDMETHMAKLNNAKKFVGECF